MKNQIKNVYYNKRLTFDQSSFRQHHSCEYFVVNICDDWLCDVENRNCVLAVFSDLKMAFQPIDYSVIKKYGVTDNIYVWFESYLCHRQHRVKFKEREINSHFGEIWCTARDRPRFTIVLTVF